jgi:CheY-like chemotaxis protein
MQELAKEPTAPQANRVDPLRAARVLVVDDVLLIAEHVAAKIRPYCHRVDFCSPEQAIALQRERKYDLLVTDLRFTEPHAGPLDGLCLLGELGLDVPPALVITGSVSAKSVAKINAAGRDAYGQQLVAGCLKGEEPEVIASQLRALLLQAQGVTQEERAVLVANLPRIPFSDSPSRDAQLRAAHVVSDRLKDFLESYASALGDLRAQAELAQWPSWQRSGRLIEAQLSALSTLRTDMLTGSEKQTLQALHDLRPLVTFVEPASLALPSTLNATQRQIAQRVLAPLGQAHAELSQVIRQEFSRLEESTRESVNFKKLVVDLFGGNVLQRIRYLADGALRELQLPDPEHKLSELLVQIRSRMNLEVDSIEFTHRDASWAEECTLKLKERDSKSWGSWLEVCIRFARGYEEKKPSAAYVEDLWPIFNTLQEIVYVNPQQFGPDFDPGEPFNFSIRLSPRDMAALAQEQERAAKIELLEEKRFYDERRHLTTATQAQLGDLKVVVLGADPRRPLRGNFTLTEHNGCWIASLGGSHLESDTLTWAYLLQVEGLSDREGYQIATASLRGTIRDRIAYLDPMTDRLDHHLRPEALRLLEGLGVKSVDLSQSFNSRSYPDLSMADILQTDEELERMFAEYKDTEPQ